MIHEIGVRCFKKNPKIQQGHTVIVAGPDAVETGSIDFRSGRGSSNSYRRSRTPPLGDRGDDRGRSTEREENRACGARSVGSLVGFS